MISNIPAYINLSGDYRYLKEGYYKSLDAELKGMHVYPSCQEIIDAYSVPLCMQKARAVGIPIPKYYITNNYVEPPAIAYALNPFSMRHSVIYRDGRAKVIAKSLTRNFTYAMCCQKIDEASSIRVVNVILNSTTNDEYADLAARVWEAFHLPLVRMRIIVNGHGNHALLSSLNPLPLYRLRARELKLLRSLDQWQI